MNREIKFRGKRIDNNEFVYGCLINYLSNKNPRIITAEFFGEEQMSPGYEEINHEVIPDSIGQFTGLKDINGVDIYEGDICKFEIKGLGSGKSQCYFIHGCFFLKVEGQYSPFPLFEYDNRPDIIIEIIGNIHENPELL